MSLSSNEIREKYINYFKEKGHEMVPSAPLVLQNDPTTLFTGSGMQPMIKYLLGERYPSGSSRIVDSQKCFRAVDIDEVGNNRHTTFFEMLGNWSFGDYWKEEQLRWIFEFLVDELKLDPKKLFVTVFEGDEKNGIAKDTESAEIWERLFKEKDIEAKVGEKIFYYGVEKNWWSRAGSPDVMPIGEPGGPDSEIFYEFDIEHDPKFGEKCHPNCDCGKYLEIANSVFMQFKKVGEGKFEKLPQQNVDFGGGLERIAAAVNDNADVFTTDLYAPLIQVIEDATGVKYVESGNKGKMQIVADHLKAATFLIDEGVIPTNKTQGYLLRRLIRRSVVKMYELGDGLYKVEDFGVLCGKVVDIYGVSFFRNPNIKELAREVVEGEVGKFGKSLEKGWKEIEKKEPSEIDAAFAFDLYQTHGFPFEITREILAEKDVVISEEAFKAEMEKHSNLSRSTSADTFKDSLGS